MSGRTSAGGQPIKINKRSELTQNRSEDRRWSKHIEERSGLSFSTFSENLRVAPIPRATNMPRGRDGRGSRGHNYQGSSHLYVPKSKREHPTALATPWQPEKPVCRFFQRGQCSNGEKRTFPHPVEQKDVHTRTAAVNPFLSGQDLMHDGLAHVGESGDKYTTGIFPIRSIPPNAGDDLHMCDCNGDTAWKLAKLRQRLATAKHIIEKLCEGDVTLLNRANALALHYDLET